MKNSLLMASLMIALIMFVAAQTPAQSRQLPADVTAGLVLKLSKMENNLAGKGGDLTFYVLADDELAQELKKGIGKEIGKGTLSDVISSSELPTETPACLWVGDGALTEDAIAYTREQKIPSLGGHEDLAEQGVSLALAVGDDGKPSILINPEASTAEGLDWNKAILKIAKVVN
jgi:hypothetical protein